jgi:hypothetical protein
MDIPARPKAIIENCATTSPATQGTLAIAASGSCELLEPGTSHKPDFGHRKGDLRPQKYFPSGQVFLKIKEVSWSDPDTRKCNHALEQGNRSKLDGIFSVFFYGFLCWYLLS